MPVQKPKVPLQALICKEFICREELKFISKEELSSTSLISLSNTAMDSSFGGGGVPSNKNLFKLDLLFFEHDLFILDCIVDLWQKMSYVHLVLSLPQSWSFI